MYDSVIGIVGLPTTGKSTLMKILAMKLECSGLKVHCTKISDAVREQLREKGLEINRFNIDKLYQEKVGSEGKEYWVERLIDAIEHYSADIVIIEGIWVIDEVIAFRKILNQKFILIGIHVDPTTMIQRVEKRFEALESNSRDIEINRVRNIIDNFNIEVFLNEADSVIMNDSDHLEDLEEKTKKILLKFLNIDSDRYIQRVSVKAIFYQENKILFINDILDQWRLPGGKVIFGEEPRQTLLRELHEELGVDKDGVSIGSLIHVGSLSRKWQSIELQYIVIIFHCRFKKQAIEINNKHVQLKWLTSGEIESGELNIPDCFRQAVRVFLSNKDSEDFNY
jgi:dephospho-CoA kinase/ADP-ribose pyrophosphatase YjhB (NUDIX family)